VTEGAVSGDQVLLLVSLPVSVQVDRDVLASSWHIECTPTESTLLLPQLAEELDEWMHLLPPEGCEADSSALAGWPTIPWGTAFSRADRAQPLVGLHRFAVSTTYSGDVTADARMDFAVATRQALAEWATRLCKWLEAIGPVLLGEIETSRDPLSVEVYHTAVRSTETELQVFAPMPQVIQAGPAYFSRRSFTTAEWGAAVCWADQRQDPPLAYLFLRDARLALRRQDLRRVVVDAATACERGLSDWIRTRRADLGRVVLEDVLKSLNGVVGLYDYADALAPISGVSRRRLSFQLADIRNRVMHTGHAATGAEAAAAIEVTAALLREILPITTEAAGDHAPAGDVAGEDPDR